MLFKEGQIKLTLYLFVGLLYFLGEEALSAPASPSSLLPNFPHKKSTQTEVPQIRVRIAKERPFVEISGLDLQRTLHVRNESRDFSGRKSIRFNCQRFQEKNKTHVRLSSPLLLASLSSRTGLLTIDNERFHGELKVISSAQNDSCDVIHITDLEDYIATLLAKEMNATWPIEALKAQAIAARTYAYHKMQGQSAARRYGEEAFFDLESSESHQVSGHFFDATEKTLHAARATRGVILETMGGELTEAFFHAKCGGHTLAPHHVWSTEVSGYKEVKDPYCQGRGDIKTWRHILSKERFFKFLKWADKSGHIELSINSKEIENFRYDETYKSPSHIRFVINQAQKVTFKKALFRRYFGRVDFESNNFKVSTYQNNLLITGEGKGHGVGMCQIGALSMATSGKNHLSILSHYFPGHEVKKIY